MDSQKMAQYFNYDAEIGDLRDKVQRQSARIGELGEAFEKAEKDLADGGDPLEVLCEIMDKYDDYRKQALHKTGGGRDGITMQNRIS